VNSRQKGARGERELANDLCAMGLRCRRGQQFSGSPDSPDVVGLPGIHPEVKRVQKLNIHEAMEQALADCGKNTAAVFHRKNNKPWLVTVRLGDLDSFVARWTEARAKVGTEVGQ
jgi:hypothetical protein